MPFYVNKGGKLIPVNEAGVQQPTVKTGAPIQPIARIIRALPYYHIVNLSDDIGSDGFYEFFKEVPDDPTNGNFIDNGIKNDMEIHGIKMILFDKPVCSADEYSVIQAVEQGTFVLKIGPENNAFSGLIKEIMPKKIVYPLVAATPTYVVHFENQNGRDYYIFGESSDKHDWFIASSKVPVYVEVRLNTSLLPSSLPSDFRIGVGLLTIPRKEVYTS